MKFVQGGDLLETVALTEG